MGDELAVRGGVVGKVQGVFYRASFEREARSRGLAGWVRNLPDSFVEFLMQGPADEVHELLDWARSGPPRARVDGLDSEQVTPSSEVKGFEILVWEVCDTQLQIPLNFDSQAMC